MPGSSGPAPDRVARRFVARLAGVAGVDLRRPAAWLAAAAAVIASAAVAGPLLPAAVIVVAGSSAVAAIGVPPRFDGLGARPVAAWWCARAAWPALGILLAAVATGRPIVATAGTAAVLAATALSYTAAATGASAALAAATALVPTLAAGAGAVAGGGAGALLAGALAAGLVLAVGRRGTIAELEEGPPATVAAEPIASRSPLLALSLASSLGAMATCYFLDPRQAPWYAALAAAWLVGLAVPEATLGTGGVDGAARRRLVRGGPLESRAGPAAWRSGLGDARRGGLLVLRQAALLGWPAVVAAVLWGAAAARPGGPLTAIAVLALLAVLIALVAGSLAAAGAGAETTLAATLLVAVFAMLAMMRRLPELPVPSPPAAPLASVVPVPVLSGRENPARLPIRRSCLCRTHVGGRARDAAPMMSRNGVASNDIRVRSVPVTRIPHPRRGVLSCE